MTDAMDAFRGARVAVLGASGFVGRWVARLLAERGARPWLVVRDRRAAAEVFRRYGVEGEILEADLRETGALEEAIARAHPHVTFNLVAYGVDPGEREEEAAREVNALLPGRLCASVARARAGGWRGQELVHAGSQSEYGPVEGPLTEEAAPVPAGIYGRSKLEGTLNVTRGCRRLGVRGVTGRLFTVYGPGEHEGRLLPSLLEAARGRRPVRLTRGTQRRDFVYVGDAAEALLRLGVSHAEPGTVVNVATGRLVSIRRFVEAAVEILQIPDHDLEWGALPTRPDEMRHADVLPERLGRLVGWTPPTTVEDGIRRTRAFEDGHGDGAG